MTTRTRTLLTATVGLITSIGLHAQTGLTSETWNNLTQSESIIVLQQEGISDRAADNSGTITDFEAVGPIGGGTGQRLRGTITPTITDHYTFWISGTDNVALWVSDDASRFNKKLVAYNLGSTNAQEWDKHANQKSVPIQLTGGQSYYIEAQVMDKDGGGHLAVGWRGQSGRYALDLNGATATQSSTKWGKSADGAIDGDTGGKWGVNATTLTNNELNSWWQVNFGQDREINQVVVHNMSTNQNRLSNFRISVLDVNDVELIGEDFFTTSGNVGDNMTWNLPASQPTARKIKIQLLGNNLAGNGNLALAEVEAYGDGLVVGQVNHRVVVPQAILNTVAADPDDTNDNNLSDAWETSTGLAASSHPEALLEYGDPDRDGISNYQEQWFGSDPLTAENVADGLTRYIWMGINGSTLNNFILNSKYYSYPNIQEHVPGIDYQTTDKLWGARYRGSITAPVTGEYRFWLSGNGGGCQLWLADGSVNEPGTSNALTDRFGKRLIATSHYLTPYNDFDYKPEQRSELISLVAGQEYYIEAIQTVQNGKNSHIQVAWEYPGQARAIVPATTFLSDVQEVTDADNDNLPDAWETTYSIDAADNGFTDLNNGEYGDPDGDSLTNLQEYQLGTNPSNADSDGDGFTDDEEVNIYGSDPLTSNNLAPVAINLPNLNQFSNATGNWYLDSNGSLLASDRRGALTYTFTVTEPGVHEVSVEAAVVYSSAHMGRNFTLSLTLDNDSEPFATSSTLYTKHGSADTMRALTPWLAAGTHTITIFHDNYNAGVRLRLDSVTVERLGGTDLDANGIPDWVEDNAASANAIIRMAASSRTSPASIEGITQQLSSTSLTVTPPGGAAAAVTATQSINDSFYTDVGLDEAGAVTFDASFLGGVITESHSITWTATNLFDAFVDDTLHIRKGDSLRLDAWSGVSADGGTFTVTLDGTLLEDANQNTSHTSGSPFAYLFDTAGSYTLVATHDGQTATVTLEVHSADFGDDHIVVTNKTRAWTPTSLAGSQVVEADDRIVFTETSTSTPRVFDVKAIEPVNRHVIARIPAGVDGAEFAVLARGTVHAFEIGNTDQTKDAQVVTQYADGSWLMSHTVVAVNLPPNVLIRMTIKNQGSLFTNGTNVWELRAGDFDANGIATVFFEAPASTIAPKLCHRTETFIEL